MTLAQKIRYFLRSLFGSRVSELLENELDRQRESYESRLRERDELIASLRADVQHLTTKIETYETVLIPIASPAGSLFRPRPTSTLEPTIETSTWARIRREWDEQQARESAEETKNAAPVEISREQGQEG